MARGQGTTFNLGQFGEVNGAVVRALPKAVDGLDPKKILAAVGRGEDLTKALREIFLAMITPKITSSVFATVVRSYLSVEELVGRCKFDWGHNSVNCDNFPHDRHRGGCGTVDIHLLQIDREMTEGDVIKVGVKQGLVPAGNVELLSFAIDYPDEQRLGPIVQLGSTFGLIGCRYSTFISLNRSRRSIGLNRSGVIVDDEGEVAEAVYQAGCRFAFVRK